MWIRYDTLVKKMYSKTIPAILTAYRMNEANKIDLILIQTLDEGFIKHIEAYLPAVYHSSFHSNQNSNLKLRFERK